MVRLGTPPCFFVALFFTAFKVCEFSGVATLEILEIMYFGRAHHPGLANPAGSLRISVEFLNLGGWLSHEYLAVDSQSRILAGELATQLWSAGISSVWAPARMLLLEDMLVWVLSDCMALP